jgi:hypothetical protein
MDPRVRGFEPADQDGWDRLVRVSCNGTFLHTRRFLSYHGSRFADASLVIHDSRDRILGVLPATIDTHDPRRIVSHQGATYGGIVHAGELLGPSLVSALRAVLAHYTAGGYTTLRYRAVPFIYHRRPASEDLYALHRLGAHCYRRDLASVIDLHSRPRLHEVRRRGLRRARSAGVTVLEGSDRLRALWEVLSGNLASRHHVQPVHSLAEMEELVCRFPTEIGCMIGVLGGEVVSGAVLFNSPMVVHAQYLCSSDRGREVAALDAVIDRVVADAHERGHRYVDFGISTECEGTVLNEGLHRYKSGFGAGGVVYEQYEAHCSPESH